MAATHPEAQWFKGAGFGLFMHWGPYSLKGIEASWPLMTHSHQHTDVNEYEALGDQFKPDKYDPEEWAQLAKAAGMRYAVLTSKHHDGYCLFDTKTTDYCAAKTGPGRDLIRPYVEAFRSAGLKIGFYFSLIDWHDPDFATIPIRRSIASPKPYKHDPARWNDFMVRSYEQARELVTNYGRIDLMWFDVAGWGADRWHSSEYKTMLLNIQPHLVVNNRLPGQGDYTTPEQNIPARPPDDWWETCMTMNNQWGYHPDPRQYKSSRRLVRILSEVVSKGGNLLLNVGPKPDGTFPHEAVQRLKDMGQWMEHSAEAIHDTLPGPHPSCFYGPMTRRGKILYLHVFDPPLDGIDIRGISGDVAGARLLETGESLPVRRQLGRIVVDLPAEKCDEFNTVVALEFKEEPNWPAP
jgi:alpha-L-fucosidase